MKQYFGNYLGICINNVDPEYRGRVQIFIPHIMPALYEGWNELGEDIKLECVGDNLPNGLPSKVIEKLTQILPWAEAAMPVIGNSVAGTYNPETGNFNQTNTPEAAATSIDLNTAANAFALNGDPNSSGALANNVKLTFYSPTQETNDSGTLAGLGNSNNRLQPGIVALSPNLKQQYGLKNGDVVSLTLDSGKKHYGYVGDTTSSRLSNRFDVYLPSGSDRDLARTPGSGSLGSLRLEAAAPKRLTGKELDRQGPALLAQVTGRSGQTSINLNDSRTAPDASAAQPSANPFYTSQEPYQVQREPTPDALTQVNKPTTVGAGAFDSYFNSSAFAADLRRRGNPSPTQVNGSWKSKGGSGSTLCAAGALITAGTLTGNSTIKTGSVTNATNLARNPNASNNTLTNSGLYSTTSFPSNYTPQNGDVVALANRGNGHALTYVNGKWYAHKSGDSTPQQYLATGKYSEARLYRLNEKGVAKMNEVGLADGTAVPLPAGDVDNDIDGDDGFERSQLVKNPTETQATTLDTTGMPQGMFAIPGPGAMLWVFFREGNPLCPVYFAASYGTAEWQTAYKASSPDPYGPQENNSNSISNQAIFRPNNAGALTFTGAVNAEKDSRAVRMAHANGGYLEFHPYGSVHYSPNEHLEQVGGTNYSYCLNREEWTQGDSNNVVIGNQWVVVGNPSQANIETIEKLTEKVKQINAEMMKN